MSVAQVMSRSKATSDCLRYRRLARFVCLFVSLTAALPAVATDIPVSPGLVAVDDADNLCSLREALNNAETDSQDAGNDDCPAGSGADNIILAADSIYTLTDADPLAGGDAGLRPIGSDVTITGNGASINGSGSCTLDRNQTADEFRHFTVGEVGHLTLIDLNLGWGCADGRGPSNDGGSIRVEGGA
jgi:hypothetical protein